ncbi:MAG: cysteine hydrolase [Oscillospiraceae bacterium]|nr:cysteine hydrolase [Oscillospiraceae bacterium]
MNLKQTALLVIDMQKGFLSPASPLYIDGAQVTVPACAAAIAACRERGIPVFFVTRIYYADGSNVEHTRRDAWLKGGRPLSPGCPEEISAEMPEEFGNSPMDYRIIKPRYSAFFATELDLILRRLGVRHVVLTGTTTPNCIRTSCYDAISLDYEVTVLSDCTSSKTAEIQESNLRDMANIGAEIIDSAAFLKRISV